MRPDEIKVFRFDAHTDYLPYYHTFFIKPSEGINLLEMLQEFKRQVPDLGFPQSEEDAVNVCGCVVKLGEPVETLQALFGNNLILEPLDTRRSLHDLVTDENDFWDIFSLLKPFADEHHAAQYGDYKTLYYASATRRYLPEYIGEGILMLAHRLIREQPEHEIAILKAIADPERGIWYHTDLAGRVFPPVDNESIIASLLRRIYALSPAPNALAAKKAKEEPDFGLSDAMLETIGADQ